MFSISIDFDKPDKKYVGGESLHLKLHIDVSTKFKARSLTITFKGAAHTDWTKPRKRGNRTLYENLTGDEEYFNNTIYLIRSDEEIVPKTYTYTTSYRLPENLPSNIEHENGCIKYSVKVHYDVAWGFDKDFEEFFYVTPKVDLNQIPNLHSEVLDSKENTFGCWCFKSDPLLVTTLLPKSGFIPGDMIPISLKIENNSDVRIERIRVKLNEVTKFTTQTPRIDERIVTKTLDVRDLEANVEPYQNKVFQTNFYLYPNHDYKMTLNCDIIKTEYFVKTEAVPAGCHDTIENSTKIMIGTIPFRTTENGSSSFVPSILPSAPAIEEQPLPSYKEAMHGNFSASSPLKMNYKSQSPSEAPLASIESIYD